MDMLENVPLKTPPKNHPLVTPNEVRGLLLPSVTPNAVRGLNHWRREKVPSSNSTQKILSLFWG